MGPPAGDGNLVPITFFSLSCMGEGNGNPLQCSCLENPRDGGAWWAAIYGVAQSRTRLKQLSSSNSNVLVISVCLFFSSSRSLVNIPYICSIVFPSYWIIFTIIILNSFSEGLPISTSFKRFPGILPCLFIWDITFCFFILIYIL